MIQQRNQEFESALVFTQKAIKIHSENEDQWHLGDALRHLGEIQLDLGNYEQALTQFEQALGIKRELNAKEEEMLILSQQSVAYLQLKNLKKALSASQESAELLGVVKSRSQLPQILFNRYRVLQTAGQDVDAKEALQRSHQALMDLARKIQDAEFYKSFLQISLHQQILLVYHQYFPKQLSEAECYQLLRQTRWPDGIICPHCNSDETRVHGKVEQSSEKRHRCQDCNKTFSDRTETSFANRNLPLSKLFQALLLLEKEDIHEAPIAQTLSNFLHIHPKTAVKLHRSLSKALQEDPVVQGVIRQLI